MEIANEDIVTVVSKMTIGRTLLRVAATCSWDLLHMDLKNHFFMVTWRKQSAFIPLMDMFVHQTMYIIYKDFFIIVLKKLFVNVLTNSRLLSSRYSKQPKFLSKMLVKKWALNIIVLNSESYFHVYSINI